MNILIKDYIFVAIFLTNKRRFNLYARRIFLIPYKEIAALFRKFAIN